jgi:hypothetical protein
VGRRRAAFTNRHTIRKDQIKVSTPKAPDSSERPQFGTTTQREPGTGRIVTIYPDGRRVVEPDPTALTTWPNENPPAKSGK